MATHPSRPPLAWRWLPALGVLAAASAPAQPVRQVVITGSVLERALLDAPYAISVVDAASLRAAGPMVNLSEAPARVPGLTVANRNNYAQDLQSSSRGFGARGVRLYTDGIPASRRVVIVPATSARHVTVSF